MKAEKRGFNYHVSLKRIRDYQKVPIDKRLLWLYQMNILRKGYPKKIINLQDMFREGKI